MAQSSPVRGSGERALSTEREDDDHDGWRCNFTVEGQIVRTLRIKHVVLNVQKLCNPTNIFLLCNYFTYNLGLTPFLPSSRFKKKQQSTFSHQCNYLLGDKYLHLCFLLLINCIRKRYNCELNPGLHIASSNPYPLYYILHFQSVSKLSLYVVFLKSITKTNSSCQWHLVEYECWSLHILLALVFVRSRHLQLQTSCK